MKFSKQLLDQVKRAKRKPMTQGIEIEVGIPADEDKLDYGPAGSDELGAPMPGSDTEAEVDEEMAPMDESTISPDLGALSDDELMAELKRRKLQL